MRQPHRKQLLAAALLLTHLPVSVLSDDIIEKSLQTEATKQNEQKTDEEPILPDFSPEETGEPTKPPVSQEPNETPEPSEPSGTMEIPADENTPDIPDQDESETPEPSDSDIEETPSPEVPEEMPDTDSMDEPPVEETPIPEESPLPDDEEAFSVSEAILEYGYAYAAAYAESVIYEDTALTAPLFTLKEDGGVLLITEETETAFKVWWLTYADEPLSGYIAKSDIHAAGRVGHRDEGVVDLLPLTGSLAVVMHGIGKEYRLVQAAAKVENLAGTSALFTVFPTGHALHFFRADGSIKRLGNSRRLMVHIFHHSKFLSWYCDCIGIIKKADSAQVLPEAAGDRASRRF